MSNGARALARFTVRSGRKLGNALPAFVRTVKRRERRAPHSAQSRYPFARDSVESDEYNAPCNMNRITQQGSFSFRWLVALFCVGALTALFVQWRAISELRRQNDSLRAEQRQVAAVTRDTTVPSTIATAELEQLRKDQRELMRLRNEVRQLREQVTALKTTRTGSGAQEPAASLDQGQSRADAIRQLGVAS